jgi:hypothetical protein
MTPKQFETLCATIKAFAQAVVITMAACTAALLLGAVLIAGAVK